MHFSIKNIFAPRISLTDKIFFVQQLGVMIRTGVSLASGLRTLAEQTTSKSFKVILTDIQQMVERGNVLSAGLEKYHNVFGELFINMVKAGEVSGKLEDVLRQLFIQMKKDHEIVAKVRGALTYPAIVLVMMVVIGIIMMVYVIPNITGIFKELNMELPLPTRILIGASDFMVAHGLLLSLAALIVGAGVIWFVQTPSGKKIWHGAKLKLPIVSGIIRKVNNARFARTMSSLLRTDIPIVQSFEITANIVGNVHYKHALLEAKEKIKKGNAIEVSLQPYKHLFPPVLLQMLAVGEQTGAVDTILEEIATFYEDDVAQTMNELPTIIEPVLVVILGVSVGAMAVAVIMPMYSISQGF